MKKLMMLGGTHFQIPAINYAKRAGYRVITVDYKPNNPGHSIADEYYNVSTTDEKEVLKIADHLNIDGILSYASDPGAPTAAYVAEKLALTGNPYESVLTLQKKDRFRNFLKENGFNTPKSNSFSSIKKAKDFANHLMQYHNVIVKPVDSSGSKGVSMLDSLAQFDESFQHALNFSIAKKVVIEEFINKSSFQMDGDGFVWNGSLVFSCFGTQHNNLICNPYAPIGISFPYVGKKEIQERARKQVDRIMTLLNMKVGGVNIEFITDENGDIYLIEIGPRSGGNLIPEVIKYSTDVDLIAYSVEGALGKDCSELQQTETKGYYSSYILHAQEEGKIEDIFISESIKSKIVEKNIFVKKGGSVKKFDGSHHTLGTFILKFLSQEEMISSIQNMSKDIKIVTTV